MKHDWKTTILLSLIRTLLPYVASFLGALFARFMEKNPKWDAGAKEGLAIMHDMALHVVEDVHGKVRIPKELTIEPEMSKSEAAVIKKKQNAYLREIGIEWLAARWANRGISFGETELYVALHEAYAAWQKGARSKRL